MDLRGKTVLITGAARGIGAEAACRLAARGANLALLGLEPAELERVASRCGSNAAAFECDVTDRDGLDRAVDDAAERFGSVDVVVANAGIASVGPARSIDPRAFERTIEVNLIGVWRTVRACLPRVIEREGYVLVVASLAAALHGPGLSAYSAAKAGAEAFADSLRIELGPAGVDVGVGYFSFLDTDLVRAADAHPALAQARTAMPGPFGRVYPVSAAGEAIANGIERRRRRVVAPGWVRPVLLLRTLLAPVLEGMARGDAAEADRRFAADVERRGAEAASAPLGPGGAAAEASGARLSSTPWQSATHA